VSPNDRGIFLSYCRADALDFTLQLARDLRQHGYFVWFDLNDIEKGGLFEVRIEQGIRQTNVLAAIMTPASVREQSVCRDEVAFALNESRLIVPLKVHPDVKPTLLLARRNWIDFTTGYKQGLEALLRFLAGDETVLLPPRLPTVTGVAPLDFGPEIARYSAGFIGRAWLTEEIDRWLGRASQRALVIVGEPGVGKSAIAAWLSLTRPEVAAVHFCTQRNTRSLDAHEFVASLVGQLHARLPSYAKAIEAKDPARRRSSGSDAFRELIVEPVRGLPASAQSLLIIVDSLDEAWGQAGDGIVDLLVRQAPDLPAWLRILTTTRPEQPILERVRSLRVFVLSADRLENRADVRAYVRGRLQGKPWGNVAGRLEALAAGNFLYSRLALDALVENSLAPTDLGQLTAGLADFFGLAFRRRFPDVETYLKEYAPLLRALAAAEGPLPFTLLVQVARKEPEQVHQRLGELRTYLRISGSREATAYAFFHKSLADWLTDREAAGGYWCDVRGGHAQLAEALLPARQGNCGYALRHLVAHLVAAGRAREAADRLLDLAFLEAQVQAGLVFNLVEDFRLVIATLPEMDRSRRLLALLEEALRRDVHFIARHARDYPQGLFQCLWNSGWWYDSPEAARHYDLSKRPGTGSLPWDLPKGERLSTVLECWRLEKERTLPGFAWLRSLRPPALHLGTAQKAVLRGHEGGVYSVTVSGNGRRLASGSEDQTVRVWDVPSGQELLCLRGHEGGVYSVTVSGDGRRLVSGSFDRTVRMWDARSGQELLCLRGHEGGVYSVAVSGDGRRLVSGSFDRTVRIWDATSGQELLCLRGHEGGVCSVAVSSDGCRLVSGSFDRTVRIWDAASGQELLCLRGHEGGVNSVAVSGDGCRLVSGSWDQTVRVWNATSGECMQVLKGDTDVTDADIDALARGPNSFPLIALAKVLEMVVQEADSKRPRAWFPGSLKHVTTHPCGHSWVGGVGSYLYLVTLEGGQGLQYIGQRVDRPIVPNHMQQL
jgi:hypothetical protein